jgi:hypothetical protein
MIKISEEKMRALQKHLGIDDAIKNNLSAGTPSSGRGGAQPI